MRHPMLKPALRRGWRDRETVRFGVAPAHALVVGPVDTATGSFLSLIDGTRSLQQLIEEAALLDLPPEHVRGVVDRLGAAGLLEAPTAGGPPAEAVRADQAAFEQLRPDLASLSVRHPEPAGALSRMGARRAVRVRVKGAGRVGAAIAALLSASGADRVEVVDGGTVQPWDVLPGGLPAEQTGERRAAAARRLVTRCSPGPVPRGRGSRSANPANPGCPSWCSPRATGSARTPPIPCSPSRCSPPASRIFTRG